MPSDTHCVKCCEEKPMNEMGLCSECQKEFDKFIDRGYQMRLDKRDERYTNAQSRNLVPNGSHIFERSLVTATISDIFKRYDEPDIELHMTHSGQLIVRVDNKRAIISVEHMAYEFDRLYQNWLSDRAYVAISGTALDNEERR